MFNHKDTLLEIGELVRVGSIVGVIGGNDLDNCDLCDDCFTDLNYYVVPLGSRFAEEYMAHHSEIELETVGNVDVVTEIAKGIVASAKVISHYEGGIYNFTVDSYLIGDIVISDCDKESIVDLVTRHGCTVTLDGVNLLVNYNKKAGVLC